MSYIERLFSSMEKVSADDMDEALSQEYWATRVMSEEGWGPTAADQIMSAGDRMPELCAAMRRLAPTPAALIDLGGPDDLPRWLQGLLDTIYLEWKRAGNEL